MQPDNRKSILSIIFSGRMLVAFLMGFACGLPLLLTIGVLQAWMKESGVDLTWIGMITLVQIPYTWKFLWAPFMDRFTHKIGIPKKNFGFFIYLMRQFPGRCYD